LERWIEVERFGIAVRFGEWEMTEISEIKQVSLNVNELTERVKFRP